MESRMKNPVMILDGTLDALLAVSKSCAQTGIGEEVLELVNLRASQINGCAVCADMHAKGLKKMGTTDERLWTVATWREAPYFTDAERAALHLAEEMTRLADAGDVTDAVWAEAKAHYDERQLAALVMNISMINLWNRLNATTRQIPGAW
ncbi:carboxymuconolactone decarboxylase family protein [Phytomonospora sp. NPDC050363]|uniref:carboxymuconolactone decarboxylase family protein n=1 Tax=Phytomonospora sp. NPDC050363 TaxID=3155642 RepID=UPI00340D292A